jgi:hypothetical protein
MSDDEKKEKKKLYDKEYRRINKEKLSEQKKEWVKNNPDKVKESRLKNKDVKKILDKKYAAKNKAKLNESKREWARNNPDKVKATNLKYHKNKMLNDKLYKLKHSVANIIRDSFKRKGFSKNYKSIDILGCSIDDFKIYIESKFEDWMTWENYGNPEDGIYEVNKTWDIDHVIPLSTALTEKDIITLNNYKNLQPLCSYTNRFIKKDKMITK